MAKFSAKQLSDIAQQYHDLSVNVGQFRLDRIRAGAKLDDPEIVQLFGLQTTLLNTSNSLLNDAANVTLADADKAAGQITDSTKAANAAIKTLQVINKVVTIASAAGVLATAILTGDMGQIGQSAKDVVDAISG